MYRQKLYKFLGISLATTSFLCLVLLSFGYRDVSVQLTLMFLFTAIGLPLSTYLLVRRKTYFLTFNKEDDDLMDVVGRFSI
tara:strand:+ start:233 stop:475 length:243 start_codon:yes stop_codon:yes gene_type:complete